MRRRHATIIAGIVGLAATLATVSFAGVVPPGLGGKAPAATPVANNQLAAEMQAIANANAALDRALSQDLPDLPALPRTPAPPAQVQYAPVASAPVTSVAAPVAAAHPGSAAEDHEDDEYEFEDDEYEHEDDEYEHEVEDDD